VKQNDKDAKRIDIGLASFVFLLKLSWINFAIYLIL